MLEPSADEVEQQLQAEILRSFESEQTVADSADEEHAENNDIIDNTNDTALFDDGQTGSDHPMADDEGSTQILISEQVETITETEAVTEVDVSEQVEANAEPEPAIEVEFSEPVEIIAEDEAPAEVEFSEQIEIVDDTPMESENIDDVVIVVDDEDAADAGATAEVPQIASGQAATESFQTAVDTIDSTEEDSVDAQPDISQHESSPPTPSLQRATPEQQDTTMTDSNPVAITNSKTETPKESYGMTDEEFFEAIERRREFEAQRTQVFMSPTWEEELAAAEQNRSLKRRADDMDETPRITRQSKVPRLEASAERKPTVLTAEAAAKYMPSYFTPTKKSVSPLPPTQQTWSASPRPAEQLLSFYQQGSPAQAQTPEQVEEEQQGGIWSAARGLFGLISSPFRRGASIPADASPTPAAQHVTSGPVFANNNTDVDTDTTPTRPEQQQPAFESTFAPTIPSQRDNYAEGEVSSATPKKFNFTLNESIPIFFPPTTDLEPIPEETSSLLRAFDSPPKPALKTPLRKTVGKGLTPASRKSIRKSQQEKARQELEAQRKKRRAEVRDKYGEAEDDQQEPATAAIGEKRKMHKVHVDELKHIPNPSGGGFGMDEAFFDLDDTTMELDDEQYQRAMAAQVSPEQTPRAIKTPTSFYKTSSPRPVLDSPGQLAHTPQPGQPGYRPSHVPSPRFGISNPPLHNRENIFERSSIQDASPSQASEGSNDDSIWFGSKKGFTKEQRDQLRKEGHIAGTETVGATFGMPDFDSDDDTTMLSEDIVSSTPMQSKSIYVTAALPTAGEPTTPSTSTQAEPTTPTPKGRDSEDRQRRKQQEAVRKAETKAKIRESVDHAALMKAQGTPYKPSKSSALRNVQNASPVSSPPQSMPSTPHGIPLFSHPDFAWVHATNGILIEGDGVDEEFIRMFDGEEGGRLAFKLVAQTGELDKFSELRTPLREIAGRVV